MNLFYLLIPLLWLNSLAASSHYTSLYVALPLVLFGGTIFLSIWIHRLKPAGVLSVNAMSLTVLIWFLLASLPGLFSNPLFFILCGIGISVCVRIEAGFIHFTNTNNRRFELPTLILVWPLYAIYLIMLAMSPWPSMLGPWQSQLGITYSVDNEPILAIFRLLEYAAAFTLLGYMITESRDRNRTSLLKSILIALTVCLSTCILLESAWGFHPHHAASLPHFIISAIAGLSGGMIYRLQLIEVKKLLNK